MRKVFNLVRLMPYLAALTAPGVLFLVLLGCLPVTIGGSSVPTDKTFQLTEADVARAQAIDKQCALDWVGPDPAKNRTTALELLKDKGIKVKERNAKKFATAFPTHLLVGEGFWSKAVSTQAETLTHELIHYCHREIIGNAAFDKSYANSKGRWIAEVPAYAQSIRTMVMQGATESEALEYAGYKAVRMRDFYWLHDIDPVQYNDATLMFWSKAAAVASSP